MAEHEEPPNYDTRADEIEGAGSGEEDDSREASWEAPFHVPRD